MGSKVKKLAPLALLALPFAAPAFAAGSGALSGIMGAGAKKFLMNQAITAALSKATTGKIDPKAQLMAGMFSGAAGMAGNNSAAAQAAKSQAGAMGLSRDAAAKMMTAAQPQTGLSGLFAKGANALQAGYANPMSLKGAMAYGAPAAIGAGLSAMNQKKDPLDTSKDDDQAQAAYDYHMMMSKGIMSPEDARTAFASYGKGMKGDYTPGTEMGTGRYEELYPALNYTGLNRYNANPMPGPAIDKKKLREYNPYVMAADGGRIGYDEGGLTELAGSAGDRPTMEDADEHSFRLFNKPYLELDPFELEEFDEEMARLRSKFMNQGGPVRGNYNMGGLGSIPQTEQVPQGMQLEGRGGGFIPMGAKEKHDDVPAMLAKNEFVMTSDAVKAAGGGSMNKGAQVMYDLMNSLESKV